MMDVWHTQLRLVHGHFPEVRLRAMKGYALAKGGMFVYVTPAPRDQTCPANVIETFRALGYTIIHIQEAR